MLYRTLFGLMGLLAFCQAGCNQQSHLDNDPPLQTADGGDSAETYRVKFETSKGEFVIEVTRSWAPHGAARFRELVESGFYDECRIFRVLPGFMAQFGMNGDPAIQAKWEQIPDDPVVESNKPSYVTFAKTGAPNSRTTQIFINYADNSNLDRMGFAPFGRVIEGMDVVNSFFSGYGGAASDKQRLIREQGNEFLNKYFPSLDYITKATLLDDSNSPDE